MDKCVLLVDDDKKLLKLLTEYLAGYQYKVLTLSSGTAVLETIHKHDPDLVILDIMLPDCNGLDVLKEIRKELHLPVIMLTAKGDDTDRIVGLELGADDYLPKPFNPRELLARIKAVLRRIEVGDKKEQTKDQHLIIRSGGMVLNKTMQTLQIEDKTVELSASEFGLIKVLMSRPNMVLTRDQLMTLSRGRDFMAFDRSIDVHISKLRAKLSSHPQGRDRIKTVWGAGYMFVDKT